MSEAFRGTYGWEGSMASEVQMLTDVLALLANLRGDMETLVHLDANPTRATLTRWITSITRAEQLARHVRRFHESY